LAFENEKEEYRLRLGLTALAMDETKDTISEAYETKDTISETSDLRDPFYDRAELDETQLEKISVMF
jgi:hypothetical protein